MIGLSNEQKIKFSSLLFQKPQQNPYALADIEQQQKKKLEAILAQKIAYQTVNDPVQPPQLEQVTRQNRSTSGGIMQTICCCIYPESQRDKFDVTNTDFIKRLCGTLLMCKKDWLTIGNGEGQLYGWLWFTVTYIVVLTVSGNLNGYFVKPDNYVFNTQKLVKAVGIVIIFNTALPFIYMAILGCLGGNIKPMESFSLYGYSLFLVIIPTALCFIPSLFWHVGLLLAGGFLKAVFLYRNYTAKIDARGFIMFIVLVIFQALICMIVIQTFFSEIAGSSLDAGTKLVFGHHSQFHLRNFEY